MIELYAIDKSKLIELCGLFPKSASKLQTYSIDQIKNLSEVRQRKEHLHPANYISHFYRKNQIFLDRKVDVNSDLAIQVEVLTQDQHLTQIERIVSLIGERIDIVQSTIDQKINQLIWKVISRQQRKIRNLEHKVRAMLQQTNSDKDSFVTSDMVSLTKSPSSLVMKRRSKKLRSNAEGLLKQFQQSSEQHLKEPERHGTSMIKVIGIINDGFDKEGEQSNHVGDDQ